MDTSMKLTQETIDTLLLLLAGVLCKKCETG